MDAEKKAFLIFFDWEGAIARLSAEDVKRLLLALFAHAKRAENPDFLNEPGSVALAIVYELFSKAIDRGAEQYEARCEKNRANAARRWQKEMSPDAVACGRMRSDAKSKKENEKNPDNKKRESETDSEPPSAPPVISFPLRNEEFCIYEADIQEWRGLFPGLEVLECLKRMRVWLLKNPSRCSTEAELRDFISRWLEKDAKDGKPQRRKTAEDFEERAYNMDALEEQLLKANKN